MNEALLLVDIQNDYFEGGNMELHQPEKAAQKAKEVLKAFREKHKTVIHVQHIANNEGATFFLPDTLGVQIYDDVQSISSISNYIIISGFPSSLQCIFGLLVGTTAS